MILQHFCINLHVGGAGVGKTASVVEYAHNELSEDRSLLYVNWQDLEKNSSPSVEGKYCQNKAEIEKFLSSLQKQSRPYAILIDDADYDSTHHPLLDALNEIDIEKLGKKVGPVFITTQKSNHRVSPKRFEKVEMLGLSLLTFRKTLCEELDVDGMTQEVLKDVASSVGTYPAILNSIIAEARDREVCSFLSSLIFCYNFFALHRDISFVRHLYMKQHHSLQRSIYFRFQ